jgi:hypothetical protein
MTGQKMQDQKSNSPATNGHKRKPYTKPAFEYERVFETMALACGKMHSTQGACRMLVKNS